MVEQYPVVIAHDNTVAMRDRLDGFADAFLAQTTPVNTDRTYTSRWRSWGDFTTKMQVPETSNDADTLAAYAAWLASRGRRPTTIRNHLYSIYVGLRERGAYPSEETRKTLRAVVDRHEEQMIRAGMLADPNRAVPVTAEQLGQLMDAQPRTMRGARDRAVLAMWFAVASRRSELAVQTGGDGRPHGLMCDDITRVTGGMSVHLRVCKTGARRVLVPELPGTRICAVAAWEAWQWASGIVDGPAFRHIGRKDQVTDRGISEKEVRRIVARAEQLAGITLGLKGHSGRRGYATAAVEAGVPLHQIAAVTGHTPGSRELHTYVEARHKMANSPLRKIAG